MTAARGRDFDRWVRLTLRPAGDLLFIDYADECGVRAGSGEPVPIDGAAVALNAGDNEPAIAGLRKLNSIFPRVLAAAELASWLREGFSDRNETRQHLLPEGGQRHTETVPWLLPVFVQPPTLPLALPWETWVEWLLMQFGDLSERCVVMRAMPLQPTEVLQLPLTLEGVGRGSVALLEGVRKQPWYSRSTAVRQHGLRLTEEDNAWFDGSDIVVRHLGATLSGRRANRRKPKLVVTIADENPWLKRADVPEPESNMSHLLVMPAARSSSVSAADIVTHVVYALIHDFSLHEIAWIIRRCVPGVSTWLATDPVANRALRLSSALRDIIDDVRARRPHLKPELPSLIAAFTSDDVRARWPDLKPELPSLPGDFAYPSRGLTAMSNFLARSAVQRSVSVSDLSVRFPSIRFPPHPVSPSIPPHPRRADVTVESYDAFGVLRSMHAHERRQTLLRGWRYRLRIHIGRPDTDTSAVVGDVPDFDNLLPPPDGTARAIEVAVFPKSFELLSCPVQTIMLPVEGESAPVHFELRAPQHCGRVDLRIAFYWNNNLLQSYVLEAEVAAGEIPTEACAPLTVKLASAGVENIDDLAPLRPRALSVALNDDVAGSHTVMVKGTDWREQVQLNSEEMNSKMDRFRAILEEASAPAPVAFDVSVRRLAALGGDIWDMLSIGNRGDVAVLDTLRTGNDQVVQFVRHGSGRPFPWQTVYDYTLPQGQAFRDASICYANVPPVRPLRPGEKGCPHFPGQEVICVEGFWIVRHRFELLSEDLYKGIAVTPRAERATAPVPNPLVLLGVSASSLDSLDLTKSLRDMLKNELAEIGPGDAPVAEMLWKEERRPAIFVVLSHLLKGDDDLNLGVRMNAFESDPESDGANISVPVLAHLHGRGRWVDPQRPIVLLMACESARRDVGELTSLTDTFLACGAAAVAGTEWIVTTKVVADFAKHLIKQTVVDSATLGKAMKQFADASVRKKDISAFIFTVYGNADLTVGRP